MTPLLAVRDANVVFGGLRAVDGVSLDVTDGGIVGLIIAPILFYPCSKLLWLAFDLLFRPLRPEDFEPPRSA